MQIPVEGFMYPNEVELQWSVLIVLYPFITGLVAGAFILASLERVFRVQEVKPTYRLALLTALSFLLVAPLPLQLHLAALYGLIAAAGTGDRHSLPGQDRAVPALHLHHRLQPGDARSAAADL